MSRQSDRNPPATPTPAPPLPGLFPSFFLGGFECADHRTPEGHRLDVVAATQHDALAGEVYVLCRAAGLRAVREAARWPRVDRGESLLVPAGVAHGLHNPGPGRLVVQQVSGPKPWDARFAGPHPGGYGGEPGGAG